MVFLDALRDLTQSRGYAWGAAALVHMYDNLNDTSKSTVRQLVGYITLLQCWIYEQFSSVSFTVPAEDYDEKRQRACRWTSGKALPISTYRRRMDRLTPDAVCWSPYGDHRSFREFEVISLFFGHFKWGPLAVIHRPERVVQQFGYIQTIPPHPIASSLSIEEINDRRMQFGEYIAPVGQLCAIPDHYSPDYMDWFYMISHPFMSLAQPRDPPRVPLVQQYEEFVEPYMYQQSMAAAASNEADVDVHHLRHAMDDFVAIADKLGKLLNLRILIEGTEAYTVVEECVGIARHYIGQSTVGHRSRRRRRTNDH
ncbi:Protein MAIN-LIKE 1 [Glycine max]|nr:Protein MAIN-LIKE 1 [Glycine max]KAH1212825.1 Protein MAIN-LIKE 1 [Glycine max]